MAANNAGAATSAPAGPGGADDGMGDGGGAEGEAQLLVSEFPPPPFYYRRAPSLLPPPIPTKSLERASRKIRAMAEAAAAEMEQARIAALSGEGDGPAAGMVQMDGALGTTVSAMAESGNQMKSEGVDGKDEDDEGDMVAVFGEIVEDPLLVHVPDECEDPEVVKAKMKQLNRDVMENFVKLTNQLVYRPLDNKKCRDELSHNLFLMIQEANKFREHQAREILIDNLERQLEERRSAMRTLKVQIAKADEALGGIRSLHPKGGNEKS